VVELLCFYKYALVVFLDGAESSVAWLVYRETPLNEPSWASLMGWAEEYRSNGTVAEEHCSHGTLVHAGTRGKTEPT